MGSAEAFSQRATFGVEHVTSQRRPREFMLHEVVALPTPSLLVLLVVLVTTLLSVPPLVLLLLLLLVLMLVVLLLTLLLMLMLLEVVVAPAPLTARHSRKTR